MLMSERRPGPFDAIARKWLALAERRLAHVCDLRDSGRWKHYYSAGELLEVVNERARTRDAWAQIAGRPLPDGEAPA